MKRVLVRSWDEHVRKRTSKHACNALSQAVTARAYPDLALE